MAGERVVVAMSGGVDSSVAALLLVERGYDVTGLFMRTGAHGEGRSRTCCSLEDGLDARRVADRLGIPFYALNFETEFGRIIENFVGEYAVGRTPNPCVLCNRDLKFGKLFEYAASVGAGLVASGHYARRVEEGGRYAVARAADPGKDQSYVLFVLSQEQLARTVLPLGDLTKSEVRRIARRADLPVSEKPESQEVCFVPAGGHREMLRSRGMATPGPVVDRDGREVGRHDGFEFYTVGQRRGLALALGEPRYVLGVAPKGAVVHIGRREDLLSAGLVARGWVDGFVRGPRAGEELSAEVMIRYRHRAAKARLLGRGEGTVEIHFDEPQSAVAPGQAVVAYDGRDRVLGGGWIERALEGT